jgi:hypothetical protein
MRLLWFLLVVPYSVVLQGCSSCNAKLINATWAPSLTQSTYQAWGGGSSIGACAGGNANCPGNVYPFPPPPPDPTSVLVGYRDQAISCQDIGGTTCSEAYVISRGLVQFDLTPLNGNGPVSAILKFWMTQASTPNSTVLASIGAATQSPGGSGSGLVPMNVFLTLPTGTGVYVNQQWLKIANSTYYTIDVTRQVRDWAAGRTTNYGFVLASANEQPPAANTSGYSFYGHFGLDVTYNPNP